MAKQNTKTNGQAKQANAVRPHKRSASRANVASARANTGENKVSEILKDYCTTTEAAALLGIRVDSVIHLIAEGRLEGSMKVGNSWLVYKPSIEEYFHKKKPSGQKSSRPPKLAAAAK